MESGIDFLPMIIEQIQARRCRTSAVRRWLEVARRELADRQRLRQQRMPAGVPRTYVQRWQEVQACAERELKNLRAALDLIEAFCQDGKTARLGRALLLHNAAGLAFQSYCKKRMAVLVNPTYLAA